MTDEAALRSSLGIPADAEQVLIFGETSHWDPNWLQTSQEYYDRFVQKQLDRAIAELVREPRRVYGIECMFFLRMYWERNPQQHDQIRELINERRLRLTSSGVITADTVLPGPEAIVRDLLLGQEWLRRHGMTQEPKLAYFADSFGASPALPSLLNAAGFEQAAITRVDGKYFLGFRLRKEDPYPNSNAAYLMEEERTLDFVWRDRAGAEVLCHWNAFSYGQGDLLAHRGISRIYRFPVAIPDRSERNIARRVHKFARQLAPYSRTPYLFSPIGFDFVPPIPNLVTLLDRHNEKRYPSTGIWTVNAGLDDYLTLVNCRRDQLPVVELDPNPYWTGFYSARPALKERCHRLVDELVLAEALSDLPQNREAAEELPEEMAKAWWTASVASHHDYITGTSPDRVVYEEQVPWLEEALAISGAKVAELAPDIPTGGCRAQKRGIPEWFQENGRVQVKTPYYSIILSEEAGGTIVRAEDPISGALLLDEPSNDLVVYKDSGGLWRMGYEFRGGTWRPRDRSSRYRARLEATEHEGGLEIRWASLLGDQEIRRAMWFRADSPVIAFRLDGRAPKRRTVTARFGTGLTAERFLMDMPGGVVSRPLERVFSPTFWPFQHFLHVRDQGTGRGLALYQEHPGAVSLGADGRLEVIALRNAPRERAYHILPLSGNPAKGYERDFYSFVYGLEFTRGGDWIENQLAEKAYGRIPNPWTDPRRTCLRQIAEAQITLDRPGVWILANKPARRGAGRIVRLYTLTGVGEKVSLRSVGQEIGDATLCDARERDIRPLPIREGVAKVPLTGTITSIRLVKASSREQATTDAGRQAEG